VSTARKSKTIRKRRKRHVVRPDVRTLLLDSAEALIREEGYGAATVRRIASRLRLKHQVVFYYFGSLDELLVEVFRRFARLHRDVLEKALDSANPLRAMWDVIRDPGVTPLMLEFMALANHNDAIRAEIARNAIDIRNLETDAIARHLRQRGIEPRLSPRVVSILSNAVGRLLVQEATLGIHEGHQEALALADGGFRGFEAIGDTDSGNSPVVDSISDQSGNRNPD